MSKLNKILADWENNRPREVLRGKVETVLDEYFPGEWRLDGGSHIVIRSKVLKKYKKYQPYGEVTVPLKSGRYVKWFYIKDILKAIEFLEYDQEKTNG